MPLFRAHSLRGRQWKRRGLESKGQLANPGVGAAGSPGSVLWLGGGGGRGPRGSILKSSSPTPLSLAAAYWSSASCLPQAQGDCAGLAWPPCLGKLGPAEEPRAFWLLTRTPPGAQPQDIPLTT